MRFEYYYLIQDVLGIILLMFSLRVQYFFIKCWIHKGFSRRYVYALFSYSLLLIAGVTFIVSPFGIIPWCVFFFCCVLFWGMQKFQSDQST